MTTPCPLLNSISHVMSSPSSSKPCAVNAEIIVPTKFSPSSSASVCSFIDTVWILGYSAVGAVMFGGWLMSKSMKVCFYIIIYTSMYRADDCKYFSGRCLNYQTADWSKGCSTWKPTNQINLNTENSCIFLDPGVFSVLYR